ncbi:MAG TPA: TraI/MobA(P) family conjugative relaxase [Hyphomicrobium sp.]|nr:TraI/MobA(P) family conjugative relaxase [Hyphomicrobium sp.]
MIAKRVPRRAGTSSPARLVRYMVAAQGGIEPGSWKRTADYILDNRNTTTQGEKVGSYRVSNCGTDDPADATVAIQITQARNTRSKADKTYHLVFSFPPGERPPLDVLHAVEDELCATIGYADHQRISAVHTDTDHLHVHVAINKVHPTGLQNIEPFFDKQRLMEACERLEIKYGLQRTNHGLTERQTDKTKGSAKDIEAHSGVESLIGKVTREVAPAMRMAANWQELHTALGEHGLEIKPRGAGLVIGEAGLGLWCKASECGRDLAMQALTDRLGPFERDRNRPAPARKRYEPQPRQPHPSSAALFTEYQRQRQTAITGRKQGFAAIKAERAREAERIRQWAATQRLIIKAGPRGPMRKALYANVQAQAGAARRATAANADAKRKALIGGTSLSNWNEWLMQRAEAGDVDALAVLRSRVQREERMRGDLLTAERADRAKTFIMDTVKPQARKDGTIAYRTADGGLVLDRATHVQAQQATAGAALVALSLAAERFEGQVLDVRGTEQFRRDVAQLAAMHKIPVTFADPAMEMTRRAAEVVQQAKPSAVGSTTPALSKVRGRANTKGKGIEL